MKPWTKAQDEHLNLQGRRLDSRNMDYLSAAADALSDSDLVEARIYAYDFVKSV
jgi:hypothetical protein